MQQVWVQDQHRPAAWRLGAVLGLHGPAEAPLVAGGIGFGTGAHAPNEFMVIEPKPGLKVAGLAQIEKVFVDMLYALAETR